MLHLDVTGMTCEGCASAVRRALERAAPGANVQVDLDHHRAHLDGPLPDAARLVAALEAAGFGVRGT